MRRKLEMTHEERVIYNREKSTLWARQKAEKHRMEGYVRLVSKVLNYQTTYNLPIEKIAQKLAENDDFRVIWREKPQKIDKNVKKSIERS